jgi:hypothetical protein
MFDFYSVAAIADLKLCLKLSERKLLQNPATKATGNP